MKTSHLILTLTVLFIAFMLTVAYRSEKRDIEYVESLHPRVQQRIANYMEEQPKLAVGDFVNVKNHDNQESSRTLVVKEVRNPHTAKAVVVLTDPAEKEFLYLQSGRKAAIKAAQAMSFKFIRREVDSEEHGVIGYWYWLNHPHWETKG